ncbi:hypothetical protein LCL95_01610 [Bacillus timonensis]|nr:hypothetical protein [Bacillus timonensis]
MDGDLMFAVLPIISLFFYMAPVVFIIWFLFKILKLQEEKNRILKEIATKLDTLK